MNSEESSVKGGESEAFVPRESDDPIKKTALTFSSPEQVSIEPCALFPNQEKYDPKVTPQEAETSSSESDSGIKIAEEVLEVLLRRTTKKKLVKKIKPPALKFPWVHLEDVIPNFHIDDETFEKITFAEKLLVSRFEANQPVPTPIGGLCLDVQSARGGPLKYQPNKNKSDFVLPKFLVHVASQLDFMGHNGGSRVTAWVDRGLQTLEEKRREFLKMDDYLDQQSLYISSQDKFYYLRHDKKTDIFYSPERARNLICEGANFVLMRYLAVHRFIGTFEVSTVYINGNLCRNIYTCTGPSSGLINNQKLDVCKIYRTIIEECGIQHKCVTLLSLNGQILKQEWHYCDYVLQINPLLEVGVGKPPKYERIHLESKPFEDDLQLLSIYLDTKECSKKMIENYMEDHPEIHKMLADYVQTVLQLKPEDVFEFTAKYFLAFTPSLLPHTEYFEATGDYDDDDDDESWRF